MSIGAADGVPGRERPVLRLLPGRRARARAVLPLLVALLAPAALTAQVASPGGDGGRGPGGDIAERPAEPRRPPARCRVRAVVDGDTLDCEGMGRVRLIGVDAPERAQQPFGALAAEALGRLAPVGAEVLLEPDVEPRDRYGRLLSWLWNGDLLVNWALVREGWALVATYPPNIQWVDALEHAQARARAEAAGLWAVEGFACPPARFRRRACP